MKIIFRFLALLSAAVTLSSAAYAAGQGGPREACRDDVHTFCSDVQPGGGRIISCLQDHYKEISDDCYQAMQNIPARGEGHGNNGEPPPRENGNGGPPPDGGPPPREDSNGGPPPRGDDDSGQQQPDSRPAN